MEITWQPTFRQRSFFVSHASNTPLQDHSHQRSEITPLSLAMEALQDLSSKHKMLDSLLVGPDPENVTTPLHIQTVPQNMIETSLLDVSQEMEMQNQHTFDTCLSDVELEIVEGGSESPSDGEGSSPDLYPLPLDPAQASTFSPIVDHSKTQVHLTHGPAPFCQFKRKNSKGRAARTRANKRKYAVTNLEARSGFIRIANINVRGSLINRLPLLKLHLVSKKLDVMACTETGIFQPVEVGKGLSLYCAPFKNSDSRGVGLIIRDRVPHVELTKSFPVDILEVAIVGIMLQDVNIALCCLYTPGRIKTTTLERYNEMHQLNDRLKAQGWSPLWTGDFNAKIGTAPQGIAGNYPEVDYSGRGLLEFSHSAELYIANKSPLCEGKWTRVQGQSRSIIDYFLMDMSLANRLMGMFIDEEKTLVVNSDHNLMWLDLSARPPASEDIGSTPKWNIPTDEQWKSFRGKLTVALTPYISGELPALATADTDVREIVINREAEMITQSILTAAESSIGKHVVKAALDTTPHSVSSRVSAYKSALGQYRQALKSESCAVQATLWAAVKIAREKLDKELSIQANREAKRLADMAKKSKSSTPLWKLRNQTMNKRGKKLSRPVRRSDTDDMVTRPPEVKQIVTEYASNLYSFRGTRVLPEGPGPPSYSSPAPLDCQGLLDPFSTEEITELIKGLEDMKSPGPDTIPNEFLKWGGATLHKALATLYSRCIIAKCTPISWGQANTTMLFKKGDPSLLDNYRGIAMSDTMGKVFCTAINSRLVPVMEMNDQFGRLQFGFRQDFRAQDALFVLSHTLDSRREAGLETYAAFLDLRKAYDVIDRQLLWSRLLNIGLPEDFVSIVRSLYKSTITRVQYGTVFSDTVHVESGVRQGCPLSPTLFNLFIAGLIQELEDSQLGVKMHDIIIPALFFADDMVLLASSESQLQALLDLVGTYASSHALAFNGPKSSVLAFNAGPRVERVWTLQNAPLFESDCAEIAESPVYKYLGITTSTHKDPFHLHEKNMVRKLALDAKILPTLFPRAPGRPALQELVWRQVSLSGALYGAEILVPKKSTIEALDRVQRIVGRKILYDRAKSANEGILGELGWLPIEFQLHMRCMNYRARLERMEDDRLTKQVFLHCNGLSRRSPWLTHCDDLFKKYQLDVKALGARTSAFCKNQVKKRVTMVYTAKWRDDQAGKPTMRFMRVAYLPCRISPFLDGGRAGFWLHRARTDELPLNSRVYPRTSVTCPHCPSEKETLEHFLLDCPAYELLRSGFCLKFLQSFQVDLNSLPRDLQLQHFLGFTQSDPKLQATYVSHLVRMRGLTLCYNNQPLEDLQDIINQWS